MNERGIDMRFLQVFAAICISFLLVFVTFTHVLAEQSFSLVKLRILETTDLHAHIFPHDYEPMSSLGYGLANLAILMEQAKEEVPSTNSLLFDVGDTIQGSPLANYVAKYHKLKTGEVHPVIEAMNRLNYDAATLGNHDFNYGLDFLKLTIAKANFPYVSANIYIDDHDDNDSNDKNAFMPYIILDKQVKDQRGKSQSIKIGVIGFAPPQEMKQSHLAGLIKTKDIVQTAKKFIPEMQAKGTNLIIALAHSGLDINVDDIPNVDNAVYPLSKVPGIDAILFGHKHLTFPGSAEFNHLPGVDNIKGTINGVPAVEAGYWGNHLGILDLILENTNGQWKVIDSLSVNRP